MKAIETLWTLIQGAFKSTNSARRSRQENRVGRNSLLQLEWLEQRRLLSTNQIVFNADASQIVITGSLGDDRAVVSYVSANQIEVTLITGGKSFRESFQRSEVSSITFTGEDGNDAFENQTNLRSFAWGGAGDDVLVGGAADDQLFGGEGKDLLYGLGGNDQLWGGFDDDRLFGGSGDDLLMGEDGHDYLYGGEGQDFLFGMEGNDALFGDAGNDELYGGAGLDVLQGEEGNDHLEGGDDRDLLYGMAGNDVLLGGAGDDQLFGGSGIDALHGEEGDDRLDGGDDDDLLYGQAGNDTMFGGAGDDKLFGGTGLDVLQGEEGNDHLDGGDDRDLLYGMAGNDVLLGGAGDDQLFGGSGVDVLQGEEGDDRLDGGDDDDLLYGQAGNDTMFGGAGDDKLFGGTGLDVLQGEEGNDHLDGGDDRDLLYGMAGNDVLLGGAGDDQLFGGSGVDVLQGEEGDDRLEGGDDDDLLYGMAGNDILAGQNGDDQLFGGNGDDLLYGNEGNDRINGGQGNDKLYGMDGNDILYGMEDNDVLEGNAGDDVLFGGVGQDVLIGHEGNDRLEGEEGSDLLYGMAGEDHLWGGDGNDKLFGGTGKDALFGDDGSDQLNGGDDRDFIFGGEGNDSLYGGAGSDLLYGGAGADLLSGQDDHDYLSGQEGDDTLYGDLGNDVLIGGGGIDTLDGRAGDDLLVGANFVDDGNVDQARRLLYFWTLDRDYSQRIAGLESNSNGFYLESEISITDDGVPDTIRGGDGQDWFFQTGAMPYYNPAGGTDHHDGGMDTGHHDGFDVTTTLPALEGFALIDSLDHLQDLQASEALHTKIPHVRDGLRQGEHLALFELVRYDRVTHYAVSDGDWSDPSTWHDGVVPTSGARVLIPIGVHVKVDGVLSARLATVRVDGTLSFATQSNSELKVDTIVVSAAGSLEMGTELDPIVPNVKARLLITDNGAIDRTSDPFGLGRGLISHGRTTIYGRSVLEQSTIQGDIVAGTTKLSLDQSPQGWKVGDQIVIAGTIAGAQQDEVRQILGIQGNIITVAPLDYNHLAPSSELSVHVAHLSRNAVIESEASAIERRGHVMFMHSRNVDIYYAGFYKIGRTNKLEVANDPVVDSSWTLQSGTGTNPRGRYAVHFHRNGVTNDGNPAIVHGSVVVDTPGWGYVNHSSYVEFTNNVAFDVDGAAFVTEAGDEIGSFRRNIAIHTIGSGERIESRLLEQDFGHQGDGFWFQGGGVAVTDNVAAGNTGNAFVFYTRGLKEGSVTRQFQSANLVDPSIAGGAPTIEVQFVPIREFARNVGFASAVGLTIAYNLRDAPHQSPSVFSDSSFWNNAKGVDLPYAQHIQLRNLQIIRDVRSLAQTGVGSNVVTRDIAYVDLTVVGYVHGIDVPRRGSSVISGGYYNNLENIVVITALSPNRIVWLTGPIEFGTLPGDSLIGRKQFEVVTRSIYTPVLPSIAFAFVSDTIVLDYGPFANRRLFYFEQDPDAVPFSSGNEIIPANYVGLTTQQLRNKYGLTIGGELAPVTAYWVYPIRGLIAPP